MMEINTSLEIILLLFALAVIIIVAACCIIKTGINDLRKSVLEFKLQMETNDSIANIERSKRDLVDILSLQAKPDDTVVKEEKLVVHQPPSVIHHPDILKSKLLLGLGSDDHCMIPTLVYINYPNTNPMILMKAAFFRMLSDCYRSESGVHVRIELAKYSERELSLTGYNGKIISMGYQDYKDVDIKQFMGSWTHDPCLALEFWWIFLNDKSHMVYPDSLTYTISAALQNAAVSDVDSFKSVYYGYIDMVVGIMKHFILLADDIDTFESILVSGDTLCRKKFCDMYAEGVMIVPNFIPYYILEANVSAHIRAVAWPLGRSDVASLNFSDNFDIKFGVVVFDDHLYNKTVDALNSGNAFDGCSIWYIETVKKVFTLVGLDDLWDFVTFINDPAN